MSKKSSQSWLKNEELHLETYFKFSLPKKGVSTSKPRIGLKRKAEDVDKLSANKSKRIKGNAEQVAKENSVAVSRLPSRNIGAGSSQKTRKTLGDITSTVTVACQVKAPAKKSLPKASSKENDNTLRSTSKHRKAAANAKSKFAMDAEVIEISSDDEDTVPDSEDEWLDNTTIIPGQTPRYYNDHTHLKRLGDLFLPTPPASSFAQKLSAAEAISAFGSGASPIPKLPMHSAPKLSSRMGKGLASSQHNYPTPMTSRAPSKATDASPKRTPKKVRINLNSLSPDRSTSSPQLIHAEKLDDPFTSHEVVQSSQSQYLVPYVSSPKKRPSMSISTETSRNIAEKFVEPKLDFYVPSSQSDETITLLCEATQVNRLTESKILSSIRPKPPMWEVPESPRSPLKEKRSAPSSGSDDQLAPLPPPSSTQMSMTQPESQEFTFDAFDFFAGPSTSIRHKPSPAKSDIVIDDSEDEHELTLKVPQFCSFEGGKSCTQPESDEEYDFFPELTKKLPAASQRSNKSVPEISSQMSATQPESDDFPSYGFTQELLRIRNEKSGNFPTEDQHVEDSETEDELPQSSTKFRTPRLNRNESFTNISSPRSPLGKSTIQNEAQHESQPASIPTAVREFFEMFEGDESFPQSLLALEGPFSPF